MNDRCGCVCTYIHTYIYASIYDTHTPFIYRELSEQAWAALEAAEQAYEVALIAKHARFAVVDFTVTKALNKLGKLEPWCVVKIYVEIYIACICRWMCVHVHIHVNPHPPFLTSKTTKRLHPHNHTTPNKKRLAARLAHFGSDPLAGCASVAEAERRLGAHEAFKGQVDVYAALLAECQRLLFAEADAAAASEHKDIMAAAEAEHALVAPTKARVAAAAGRLEEVGGGNIRVDGHAYL